MRQWVECCCWWCCCCCCCLKCTWTIKTCCAKSYMPFCTVVPCVFRTFGQILFNRTFQIFQHSKPRCNDTFDYQTQRSNKIKISSKSKSMAAGADAIHKEERFPKVFSPTCEAGAINIAQMVSGWHGTAFFHLIWLWLVKCGEGFFGQNEISHWKRYASPGSCREKDLPSALGCVLRCDRSPSPKHCKNWQVSLQPMRTRQPHLEALGNDGSRDHLIWSM